MFVGTTGVFIFISTFIFFAYFYQKRLNSKEKERREIEKMLKSEELKSAYALIEGQDAERERISHDLHDRMGGQLAVLKVYLDLLEQEPDQVKQHELITKLQEGLERSINETRNIAHDLNNSTLNYYGLSKAIEHLCAAINSSKRVTISHHLSLHHQIENSLMRDLYQIIQELITNALKHAQANKVHIELTTLKGEVNLIFEDDGIGLQEGALTSENEGIGLKSIRKRVNRYNGVLTIDSNSGRGTAFIIEIPVRDGND